MDYQKEFEKWLAERPESVQKLAEEFPVTTIVMMEVPHYLIGYREDDKLIFSAVDPNDDYDGAIANPIYICADHLRQEKKDGAGYHVSRTLGTDKPG